MNVMAGQQPAMTEANDGANAAIRHTKDNVTVDNADRRNETWSWTLLNLSSPPRPWELLTPRALFLSSPACVVPGMC